MASGSSNDWAEGLASSLVGMLLLLFLFLLLVGIFLLVQAIHLIVTAFVKSPKNKALWITLGCVCLCGGLVGLSTTMPALFPWQQVCSVLFILSFLVLVITAWVVKVYYDDLALPEKEPVMQQVLHGPWWEPEEQLQEQLQAA